MNSHENAKENITNSPKSSKKVLFNSSSFLNNIIKTDSEHRDGTNNHQHQHISNRKERSSSLFTFLRHELSRDYLLEHDESRYTAKREKVYSFMKIPLEVERYMIYGFMQCTDSFLFICTFLPIRVGMALWTLFTSPFSKCFGLQRRHKLAPAKICDLLRAIILISCSMVMCSVDPNVLYHLIKSQNIIKLYLFYNMLEIGDRLFSSIGQDAIDALFWTATEPKGRKREHLGLIAHLFFVLGYVILHSLLVMLQATTINVAINSSNKVLLSIMMSNNFVELKGSVFKKFDKNNLFQLSCSDVRERFHLCFLLFIVVMQTMKEYAWKPENFLILLPDCVIMIVVEFFVDWVKHAFVTKFNDLSLDIYKDYTISLAYDITQTRQKYAFTDCCDLVARRMGFIPLPLGVVLIRILVATINFNNSSTIFKCFLIYIILIQFKILNSIIVMGRACDLIAQHKQEKAMAMSPMKTPILPASNSNCSSPVHKNVEDVKEKNNVEVNQPMPNDLLGTAAIFANSTVDLKNATLNEELLKSEEVEIIDNSEIITRSYSNIATSTEDSSEIAIGDDNLKRAESEPALNTASASNNIDMNNVQ